MYTSRTARRRKSLKNIFKQDPKGFSIHVATNIGSYLSGPSIKDIMALGSALDDPHKFRLEVANVVVNAIAAKTKPSHYGLGLEIPQVLEIVGKYLNKDQKNMIVDHLTLNKDMFYPYSRKRVISIIAGFIEYGDSRAFSALVAYLKVIENDSLEKLLSKVENGINNPDVQTILSKTKVLAYTKYDEGEVKAKPEIRRALIKEIANTSSIVKKIPFEVEVSLEDIQAIPPAARLSFLQFAFKPEITLARRVSQSSYWYGKYGKNIVESMSNARIKAKLEMLKMPSLPLDTVKDLLFSVSLQKNEEMTQWFSEYSKYLDVLDGKLKPAKVSQYNYF